MLNFADQLDRAFVIFRNGCRDENLDYISRLHLLELIELRAMHWTTADNTSYYKHKYNHPDIDILSLSSLDSFSLNGASAFQVSFHILCEFFNSLKVFLTCCINYLIIIKLC